MLCPGQREGGQPLSKDGRVKVGQGLSTFPPKSGNQKGLVPTAAGGWGGGKGTPPDPAGLWV